MDNDSSGAKLALEKRIEALMVSLERARHNVGEWTEENASLSRSAAEARAKNQGSGNSLMGAFLGSKFRSVMRSSAAASNAAIARDVAQKRARNAQGKLEAQEAARAIQSEIKELKQQLQSFTSTTRVRSSTKFSIDQSKSTTIDLLHKLKKAYSEGLLTNDEYEQKRKSLVAKI